MDKATFVAIVEQIVEGFEDPVFQADFAKSQAAGDVQAMMALPLAVQNAAFEKYGCAGSEAFKAAGREHAADPEIATLLGRMKNALK